MGSCCSCRKLQHMAVLVFSVDHSFEGTSSAASAVVWGVQDKSTFGHCKSFGAFCTKTEYVHLLQLKMVSVNCQAQDTCTIFSERNNWEHRHTDMNRAVLAQCVNHLVCVPAVSFPKFGISRKKNCTACSVDKAPCICRKNTAGALHMSAY